MRSATVVFGPGRTHAEGGGAEPQVEARRLDLVLHEFVFGADRAVADQRADHIVGQDAPLIHCKGERHCYASSGLNSGKAAIADDRLDGKAPSALDDDYPVVI
jgi:hypothetical protein